ncbi:nucleotidyltransferase domain-containing protein [Stutzerimonas kunmingensis]|uniref:nucleotidyltransferase domain-containing protein n=1 Tax=Stutzerimonas kunmingensis TaxID=1211807 RepID=UPI00241EE1CD|nr:nucleotidyltransferase domain-containing protein [Stutzerimonas kunmingensis]
MKFTILIGSFARGTGGIHSDIDILRIGHEERVARPKYIDARIPISYVDYDEESFNKLYEGGSLFLYHAFYEGKLLVGDEDLWGELVEGFSVSAEFSESISEYLEVLKYIDEYPGYEHSYVPYLSNVFKCAKNIGIFLLASKGKYEFEKSVALRDGCGLKESVALTLIKANAVFERSTPISPQLMNEFRDLSCRWKNKLGPEVQGLGHDIESY